MGLKTSYDYVICKNDTLQMLFNEILNISQLSGYDNITIELIEVIKYETN